MVEDREDGSLTSGSIPANAISTSVDYFEKGINPATIGKATTEAAAPEKYAEGKRLVMQSDCKSCHAVDRTVNGPAFQAIAARYRSNKVFAVPSIYRKIIYGGAGNWGQSAMIPHPQIREEEAIQMSLWILSLGDPPKAVQTLPLQGDYVLKVESAGKMATQATFVLQASYRDRGAEGQPSLENGATLVLRPATLQAENCDARSESVGNYKPFGNDTTVLNELKHNAWFAFRQVDLTGVKSIALRVAYGDKTAPQAGGRLEIRVGTAHGALIGELTFESKNGIQMVFEDRNINLETNHPRPAENPLQDLFFIFRNEQNQGQGVIGVDWIRFGF